MNDRTSHTPDDYWMVVDAVGKSESVKQFELRTAVGAGIDRNHSACGSSFTVDDDIVRVAAVRLKMNLLCDLKFHISGTAVCPRVDSNLGAGGSCALVYFVGPKCRLLGTGTSTWTFGS